jgi:hypothetical protein
MQLSKFHFQYVSTCLVLAFFALTIVKAQNEQNVSDTPLSRISSILNDVTSVPASQVTWISRILSSNRDRPTEDSGREEEDGTDPRPTSTSDQNNNQDSDADESGGPTPAPDTLPSAENDPDQKASTSRETHSESRTSSSTTTTSSSTSKSTLGTDPITDAFEESSGALLQHSVYGALFAALIMVTMLLA